MIKKLIKFIKEWLNEDGEEACLIEYLSEDFSYRSLQTIILKSSDSENIEICKKAWEKKSGLEYPFVFDNNNNRCQYLNI